MWFGSAARDITPPSLPLGGYAERSGDAEGVLDPLYCRVALWGEGERLVAIVAVDLLYVVEPFATAVREQVADALACSPADVLVAATHTHAGPAVFRSAMGDAPAMRRYERWLGDEIVATARLAASEPRPAQLRFGTAVVDRVAANRQAAGAAVDATIRALVAWSYEDRCLGAVAAFGCHPTVLPPANRLYSADLFGRAVEVAGARLAAPVVLCNGAAADVSTRFTRREQTVEELRRLGEHLGVAIAEAVSGAQPVTSDGCDGRLWQVPVAARPLPAAAEAHERVAVAAADLQAARAAGAPPAQVRLAEARCEGALAQLFFATHGGVAGVLGREPERAVLQVLRIGACEVLAAPGELFSLAGRDLCTARRRPSLVIGYANDYLGYLVHSPAAGSGEYEALMAFLTAESVDAMLASLSSA